MNKLKLYMDKLKVDKRKFFLTIVLESIAFILFGLYLFAKYNKIFSVIIIVLGLLVVYIKINDLKVRFNQLVNSKEIAFNTFYRYLVTYLNGNMILYMALKQTINYIDTVLIDDVNEFISEIESDPSLQPFLDFQLNFNDEMIKQMILLLYQTQDSQNAKEVLDSINTMIITMQDSAIEEYIYHDYKKIEKFSMFPLLLSAGLIVLISMFVLSVLGVSEYV